MGLRIEEGVSLSRYTELAGSELPADILRGLSESGLIKCEGDRLKATTKGRLVLNSVTEKLLLT